MAVSALSPVAACTAATFSSLPLFGAEILHTTATPVTNYTQTIPSSTRYVQPAITVTNASFCNVTITYAHPGLNDTLTTEIWLPSEIESWNRRLQAVGGGGWTAGRYAPSYARMAGAVYEGYVAATTDGGIVPGEGPESWGLVSEGNLNRVALENFGARSLGDLVWMSRSTSPSCCFSAFFFLFLL
jgi:feruloyl esterase